MIKNKSQNTLERKLYRSFLLLSALVILLSLGMSLYLDMTRQSNQVDASISNSAAYVSKLPSVIAMLKAGYPDPNVTRNIDALCDSIPDISAAVICDQSGLRFYHTDRQKTGESYVDGEERPILEGAEPYITTGYSTMDKHFTVLQATCAMKEFFWYRIAAHQRTKPDRKSVV